MMGGMDDLIAFLRTQLDEDEQDARWSAENMPSASQTDPNSARFDPEHVLREVESKRRILNELVPFIGELDEIADGEGMGSRPHGWAVSHLLKLLALPYADHPEYQPGWAPE